PPPREDPLCISPLRCKWAAPSSATRAAFASTAGDSCIRRRRNRSGVCNGPPREETSQCSSCRRQGGRQPQQGGRVFESASTLVCTPASLAQEAGTALGEQRVWVTSSSITWRLDFD